MSNFVCIVKNLSNLSKYGFNIFLYNLYIC